MFYHWLGSEADELDEYMKAMVWERHEIERHQHECKPVDWDRVRNPYAVGTGNEPRYEADGFITVYPEVK